MGLDLYNSVGRELDEESNYTVVTGVKLGVVPGIVPGVVNIFKPVVIVSVSHTVLE